MRSRNMLLPSSVVAAVAAAALFAGCGPGPKTPVENENENENENTSAKVLRLIPSNVDMVWTVREIGRARDIAADVWGVARGAPGAGKFAPTIEREFAREFVGIEFTREGLTARGLDLGGSMAFLMRMPPRSESSGPDVIGALLPVADRAKLLDAAQAFFDAEIERSGADDKRKTTRGTHPAGRDIVSIEGRRWSEFRWDIAFRDGYALFVHGRPEWTDDGPLPPKPSDFVVEWLDLPVEESLWEKRFATEFRGARKPHDSLYFVSFTHELGSRMREEASRAPELVRDLAETRGLLVTGTVEDDGGVHFHGQAPNPMVGKLVRYFRAAPGGGDPMILAGGKGRDTYRVTLNPELLNVLPKDDLGYMADDLRELGLDLRADFLDNFTGAACLYSGPGYDDLTVAMGIRDASRSEGLLKKVATFVDIARVSADAVGAKLTVSKTKRDKATVHDIAIAPAKGGDTLHLYMTVANGLLVLTTEAEMLARTLSASATARPPHAGGNVAGEVVFSVDYFASGYMRVVDPAKAVRAFAERFHLDPERLSSLGIPGDFDLREFPKGLPADIATIVDSFRYFMDRAYDIAGGYGLRGDGFVLEATVRTL